MSTVDDIMKRQQLATQVNDDDDKKGGATAQTSQQTSQQTQQPVVGQTQQQAQQPVTTQTQQQGVQLSQQQGTRQPQQQSAVTPEATQNAVPIDQASARVNYSTRELVPVQNIAPQGKSQAEARVNYTTPVWESGNSDEDNGSTYSTATLVAPTSRKANNNDTSYNSSIQKANANRQSQMARLVDYLNKQYPEEHETEEEKKKRIKRERAAAIMAAIGDGITAISNIALAKRGAQSTFKAENGMLPRWEKAYEERVAKQKADAKERMEALAKMYSLSKDDLDAEMKIDSNEKDEARKDAEQERKNRLAVAQSMRWAAAAETDKAKKDYYVTQADLMERGYTQKEAESVARVKLLEAKTEKEKAEAGRANRQGTGSWVSPGKGKSGGGKSSTGYTQTTTKEYTDSLGQPHRTTTTTVRTPQGKNKYSNTKKLGL